MRLIRDGEKGGGEGGGGYGGGRRGRLYTYRYTVTHQNDSCIKMGSDESHFNVSIGSNGQKSQDKCSQTTTFLKRKESRSGIEPMSSRLSA